MRKKLTSNLGYKILSIIFAVMLWLTVLNISDPQKTTTIEHIPITIMNENAVTGQDKVYKVATGKTATVEVTGPRTIIDSLDASSFEAKVDLSKLSITNALEVDVQLVTVSYRSKVDIDVQTTMRIEIEDLIEEEYEIEVDYKSHGSLPTGYVVHETKLDVKKVKVKAPVSTMNKIAKIVARLDLSSATEDVEATSVLYACDARGNILDTVSNNISFEVPQTKVSAVIYSVKQVPITYEIKEENYENTIFTGTSISKEYVTIKGRKEDLASIKELKLDTTGLTVTVDKHEYFLTYDVQSLLPKGVYLYDNEKTITIKVTTDAIITREYSVPVSDIAIKTPAEGYTAYIDTKGEVKYVLRARKSILDMFVPEDNMLYVSAKNLVEGEYNIRVQIDLDDGIELMKSTTVVIKVVPKETTTVSAPPTESSDENTSSTTGEDTTSSEGNSESGARIETDTTLSEQSVSPVEEETTPRVAIPLFQEQEITS